MLGLADVPPPAAAVEELEIRGHKLSLRGLSGEEWALIYARFPFVGQSLSGAPGLQPLPIEDLQSHAAIIALALGRPDPEAEREVVMRFDRDEHRLLVETTMRLSMPGAIFGPLLYGAAADPGVAPATAVPDTK